MRLTSMLRRERLDGELAVTPAWSGVNPLSVIACPSCHGRTPSASINCVHCGILAPTCWKCGGIGKCPNCHGDDFKMANCSRCGKTGKCPECNGRKRAWAGTGSKF